MPVLGVTGGIATGKSSFVRALLQQRAMDLFDADRCAHGLLHGDAAVHLALRKVFGAKIFDQGRPDRRRLRELIFADGAQRKKLETILHPPIRLRWTTLAEKARAAGTWLCVDIPLLFETNAQPHFDRVIVVACSPTTQRRRLQNARGLDPEMAGQIIAAQLDLNLKIKQADHLIWNDAPIAGLDAQAGLFSAWLASSYG